MADWSEGDYQAIDDDFGKPDEEESVPDVKGQVDWQAVAARALNKTGADSWTHDKCEETLRTTFEPLVRAALVAQADNYALAGTREALRAALDDFPKVGGG